MFTTTVSGFLSGESSSKSLFISGALSANRTTPDWKLAFSAYSSFQRTQFDISDTVTFTSRTSSQEARGLVVKSLGHQFSAGIRSSAVSSTTLNQDLVVLVGPALEYDFFPYAQATRRQVLILVDLGFIHSNYTERTIFGRLSEFLVSQRVTLAADVKQHWGALRGAVEFSAYWGDLSKNRLEIHTGLDVRVFRGFVVNNCGWILTGTRPVINSCRGRLA